MRGYKRQCRNTKDYETIMNNYMAIEWKTWKNGRNGQILR